MIRQADNYEEWDNQQRMQADASWMLQWQPIGGWHALIKLLTLVYRKHYIAQIKMYKKYKALIITVSEETQSVMSIRRQSGWVGKALSCGFVGTQFKSQRVL
jgi:hypothetical protein